MLLKTSTLVTSVEMENMLTAKMSIPSPSLGEKCQRSLLQMCGSADGLYHVFASPAVAAVATEK